MNRTTVSSTVDPVSQAVVIVKAGRNVLCKTLKRKVLSKEKMIKRSPIIFKFSNILKCPRKFSITPIYSEIAKDGSHVKPYNDIPGPRGIIGLGNLYQYLPIIGKYSWLQLHKAGFDKYQKYGPIVREVIVPGQDIVWLYDPNDIVKVLNERQYPQRRSHLALEKYRKDRPHIYRTAGLLPTNGPDWWHIRSETQKEISAPRVARNFLHDANKITQEFINHLRIDEDFDMLPELSRLNLELTCAFTFGKRLHPFSLDEHVSDSRSSRLIHAAKITNSTILPTDQGFQFWRYFETPTYKRLKKAQEYMESVAVEYVTEWFNNGEKAFDKSLSMSRGCLISSYMKNKNLERNDIIGIATDLLLAGIDTTSYTSAFAIYYIATNAEIQERLYEESKNVLMETNSNLEQEFLNASIPFTRAVLKEVFRMNPVSIGVGRILNSDTVLSGYLVPKGTVVVTQNMVSCRLEKYFTNPLKFLPERWLTSTTDMQLNIRSSVSPYLVLPFGHGIRACIARRFAEQNMIVLLLRLIRNFKISWSGIKKPLDVETLLINKPSAPVLIRLSKR